MGLEWVGQGLPMWGDCVLPRVLLFPSPVLSYLGAPYPVHTCSYYSGIVHPGAEGLISTSLHEIVFSHRSGLRPLIVEYRRGAPIVRSVMIFVCATLEVTTTTHKKAGWGSTRRLKFVTKLGDLSFIPQNHMVEGKNWLPKFWWKGRTDFPSSPLTSTCVLWCSWSYAHTHKHTRVQIK